MAAAAPSVPRMWNIHKELFNTVESAISRKEAFAQQDLETALLRHKPDFISLIQNPDKKATDRSLLRNASIIGLPVHGHPGIRTLTTDFINEAVTISDLFDLNELAAVDLLRMGETQQSYFPGLSRGLVAVILYYDGKASLVAALRMLIQARQGRTWALPGLGEDIVATATRFTDQIMRENLVSRILELLETMDLTSELTRLQQPAFRALGPPKHRKMVTDKITEIQQNLADCLFCWSCQGSMNRQDTLRLIGHLSKDSSVNPDGTMSNVSLAVLMALLYSIDVRILEEEDAEAVLQQLPIISDPAYRQDVHRELSSDAQWANPGLKAVVQFAWSLTLHRLSQYIDLGDMCDEEDSVVNAAIGDNVFFFLKTAVIANSVFFEEEYYLRKIHNLVTDFIEHMPLKVKELRNSGEETARIIVASQQEGLDPPHNLSRHFEHMLTMIGELYSKDPLNLELALEFWCPSDSLTVPSVVGYSSPYVGHPSQKQISLFKFVRLAGDMLLAPLYIPYISMLTGLANGTQCAHQCFNLLKMNGASASSQLSAVSWDHFFESLNQYFISLRQEAPPVEMQAYHYYRCGITPQEVDGLRAVLQLIARVVEKDENARIALSENQQWLALVMLFGLVSCSVPPKLKAELLHTITAFASTPETGTALWQSMEMSQILQTVSSARRSGGIQIELEEIEARNEEYPLTLAFMELINVLIENPIPAGLGIGFRAPGFQPYMDFLKDSIFLRFTSRGYKRPEEKWEVGAAVLQIFHKLLLAYEVSMEDFMDQTCEVQGEGVMVANKPPGYVLLVYMLSDSNMLKMILFILDEAIQAFDKYLPFPGKDHLERVTLLCLQMIETVQDKQNVFLDALRQSGTSLIVSRMDRLLLGINPRSGRPDHLVNIAKYITYGSFLPRHGLSALHILIGVCQSPLVQPKIVGLFTADETFSRELVHGFAVSLESDEVEKIESNEDYLDVDVSLTQVRNRMRENVIWLLLSTIDHPAPNLAHFLLGYELRKPVEKTNLQDPGVLGCPRTCLHSIITVLSRGVDARSGLTCLYYTPKLAELAYRMIYVLCSNQHTYGPTLRYLRMHDFFHRQAQHLPFQPKSFEEPLLMQQSWLLKSVVVELRVTSANSQRSHTQRLMDLLLSDSADVQSKRLRNDSAFEPDYPQHDGEYSIAGRFRQFQSAFVDGRSCRKILSILNSIDFSLDYPAALELDIFSVPHVEQVINSCEQRNEEGLALCNVKNLHRTLVRECNGMTGALSSQSPIILREIQQVCSCVVERNAYKETVYARRQAFDAWRQAVEILLTACPVDLLNGEKRQNLLFELLQDLLDKVSKAEAVSELTSPVAGVILTLMAHLSQCFIAPQSAADQLTDHAHYASMLDGHHDMPVSHDVSTILTEVTTGSRTQYASSFQVVLRGLLDHIIRCSASAQRVRAYLYGALLYYLEIARKPKPLELSASATVEQSVAERIATKESEYERLARENMDTLNNYGQNLMDIICRDACDGHDVGRMLALACLDMILSEDYQQVWLTHMSSKGYLQHIVDMLLHDDQQLQALLLPQPEPLRALYIFQSKICMLTKTSAGLHGARLLLDCGVTSRLAECSVFDLRPEPDRAMEGFVPSVLTRYRQQILFPVLRLCLSLLTSFGSGSQLAASQVLKFVVAHADIFLSILRDRQSVLTLEALQELQLTTAVIGQAAVDGGVEEFLLSDAVQSESLGIIKRLQRQMFALLPKYCLTERQQKRLEQSVGGGSAKEEEDADVAAQMQIVIEEILANVTTMCRSLVSKPGPTSKQVRILFEPSLVEGMTQNIRGLEDLTTTIGNNTSRPLNLGVIVYLLNTSTQQFMTTFDSHKQLYHKCLNVSDLSTEALKEFYSGENMGDKVSMQQRNQMAFTRLSQILQYKSKELQLLAYIIENCMLLLWRHLEFYLVSCKPLDSKTSLMKLHAAKHMRRMNDTTITMEGVPFEEEMERCGLELSAGLSYDQLEQLKQEAVACINETLLKRLLEMEQCYTVGRTRFGFVTAMVRRIRRLLRLHAGSA